MVKLIHHKNIKKFLKFIRKNYNISINDFKYSQRRPQQRLCTNFFGPKSSFIFCSFSRSFYLCLNGSLPINSAFCFMQKGLKFVLRNIKQEPVSSSRRHCMLSSFFFHSKISISCTVVLFPLSIILILLLFYSFILYLQFVQIPTINLLELTVTFLKKRVYH